MRQVVPEFDLFVSPPLPHEHAQELEAIDRILCQNPTLAQLVWKDLQQGRRQGFGRPGLAAEQALRAAILKQMNGFSYEELAFHLADSRTYLRFCGFTHPLEVPKKSALAETIKRIRAKTWEQINRILVGYAEARGVECGDKVRIDATVTASNIHHPTDNALLFDGVRALSRLLRPAHTTLGIPFRSPLKRAKRYHMAAMNAKRQAQRLDPYRKLIQITRRTLRRAEAAIPLLRQQEQHDPLIAHVQRLADQIEHYIPLVRQVLSQSEQRILHGASVPAEDKLVSIFEPHTDIIRKDNRDTYYGHKVTFTGGASGLLLDWVVEDGNPADSTLFLRMLDRHHDIYGRYPRQSSADGGFASTDNLRQAKARGLTDVVFAKKRGLSVEDMASSIWSYRRLRNFRAGIEGMISFLKRVFGLGRCTWKGEASFASYIGASVVSANLILLARHLMT